MTSIKITNCTLYYNNGTIRKNQNVTLLYKNNPLSHYTKEELLKNYKYSKNTHTNNTTFKASNTSKIKIIRI